MKVSILFLPLLLLASSSESRTGETKKNLSDDEEFESILERALLSERDEESNPRWTSEPTGGQVDLDDDYSFDENWKVRRDMEEEGSLHILKEADILRELSGGEYTHHPRYDRKGVVQSKNNLNNLSRRSRGFDADDLMADTLYQLSGTKTYVCDNSLEIYSTISVNVDETAILYSPMFLQRREYPNNSNCGWRFETSDPHHLAFNCSDFDVREGDYLSLRDDESLKLERFSGGRRLNHITKMNSTFVVFYSNDKETGRGFNCSVTSVRASGSVDNRQVEVEPNDRSEIKLTSKLSVIAKLREPLSVKAELPAVDARISPRVKLISEDFPKSGEIPSDYESLTNRSDSSLSKSSAEKVDEGGSSADNRLTYLKIDTTSSSMHAGVYSRKVMQTVIDAMGNRSLAALTFVNSTRMVGITTNVVEKRVDGGGAIFAESYVYDPTSVNLPGHTTTSVLESNMSSETNDKTEFVIDDLTGERHQEDSSYTKKASSETIEIKSSRISFPEEFVEPTPPM